MFLGAIFDLDGTLLNTLEDLQDSVNAALKPFGFPLHAKDDIKRMVGKGFRNLMECSIPKESLNDAVLNEALATFVAEYDARYLEKTRPYEGLHNLLRDLQNKGIQLGVNSNKRTEYTQNLIKKFFPDINFIDVLGERDGIKRKPDPTSALEILKNMGLSRGQVVYIGDSSTDMQTAKNAGLYAVGVLWGFRDAKELTKNGADMLAGNAGDIRKLFISDAAPSPLTSPLPPRP